MSHYSLDVESFISEVQKYPELWDVNCEEYRHKYKKIRAWGEVAKVFVEDYNNLSKRDKDEIRKYIQLPISNRLVGFLRNFFGKFINKS